MSTPRDAISMTSMGFFFAYSKTVLSDWIPRRIIDTPPYLHDVGKGGVSGLVQTQVGRDDSREGHVDGLGAGVGLTGSRNALRDGVNSGNT